MKAIVYDRYGPPDVLRLAEVDKPAAGDTEVLIHVRAASVNPLDWHFVRGTPYFVRMMTGFSKPKSGRLGVDVAGRVEAVGKKVTRFKPGDHVFGACWEAFSEYARASESAVVVKPDTMTFEQAASINIAGITALQALRDKGRVRPGHRVLVNGAAGGVGTFAVQIAKTFGAELTGVCSTRNLEMVRSIGADHVIDYTREDFTTSNQRYDVVLDNVGNHSLAACRRVLHPRGTYIQIGGGGPDDTSWTGPLPRVFHALVLSRFVRQNMGVFLAKPSQADLTTACDLVSSGKVTPIIDRRYSLAEVPDAIRYLEQGHARGKVVISMESGDRP